MTTSAWTAASAARVARANDQLRVGLIGAGGRGTLVARLMRGTAEDIAAVAPASFHDGQLDPRLREPRHVEIAAVCDADRAKIAAARRWTPQAATYDDFRELLADPSLDAVIIATPDSWHATMLILACEAGKDVYLEKPVMYRLGEADAMREVVRRTGRIVQIGTQHRSADHIAEAARLVQGGRIGEVKFVRVWNYMPWRGGQPAPDSEPPAGLNWDAWLGPAPAVPFNSSRLDYRLWMDYTNGIISDYGNHRFDSVHQVMGAERPLRVASSALKLERARAGDIFDCQQATYEYPGFILSYEAAVYNGHGLGGRAPGMNYYGTRGADDRPHGMAFYGADATLLVDRIGLELYPEPGAGRPVERLGRNEDEPTPRHAKNFVDCVRARREPFANIEVGVRATAVACIGNVAAWTGRKLAWDDASWQFPGDDEANQYLFRPHRAPWDLVKLR
jgi:predicted dehydrogenase